MTVDVAKCLARVWNEGKGAQCQQKPVCGGTLCKRHLGKRGTDGWMGEVTGEIPEAKLKEFEKRSRGRGGGVSSGVTGARADGGGGGASGASGARADARGECSDERDVVGKVAGQAGSEGTCSGSGVLGGAGGSVSGALSRLRRAGFGSVAAGSGQGSGLAAGRGAEVSGGAARGLGRGRVVSGFGDERVEDLRAQGEQRDAEACDRQRLRREQGERGDVVEFGGRPLDRSEGGAFSLKK